MRPRSAAPHRVDEHKMASGTPARAGTAKRIADALRRNKHKTTARRAENLYHRAPGQGHSPSCCAPSRAHGTQNSRVVYTTTRLNARKPTKQTKKKENQEPTPPQNRASLGIPSCLSPGWR